MIYDFERDKLRINDIDSKIIIPALDLTPFNNIPALVYICLVVGGSMASLLLMMEYYDKYLLVRLMNNIK